MANELFIRNPHSILATLQSRPKSVLEINLPREKKDPTWDQIAALGQRERIAVREASGTDVGKADFKRGHNKNQNQNKKAPAAAIGRESGHGALIQPKASLSVEEVFSGITTESRGVWLALDCLQDPQNLGAIFRSASFFGVKGLILTQERSVPMTSTVYDIASGGVETIPFSSVINLQRAFEKAKEAGLWILGTSEHAKGPIQKIKNDRPWLVVVGNEENGMRRLTEEACDMTCTIPSIGDGVKSLNVSVATGIVLASLSLQGR
jgi:23S rRNA (guanosine2251-2'-O)-methyltransferase